MWASAGAFAAGGVGVSVIAVFLVLGIGWEMIRRRTGVSVGNKASDADWK